jgi:uncharacterized membrane protein YkoI
MGRPDISILGLAVLVAVSGNVASAIGDDRGSKRRYERNNEVEINQDDVRAALQRGEIRPLSEIMSVAEKVMPGQIVGVKVKRLGATLVYEFKIIASGGRLREIYIDAANLDVVKVE